MPQVLSITGTSTSFLEILNMHISARESLTIPQIVSVDHCVRVYVLTHGSQLIQQVVTAPPHTIMAVKHSTQQWTAFPRILQGWHIKVVDQHDVWVLQHTHITVKHLLPLKLCVCLCLCGTCRSQ